MSGTADQDGFYVGETTDGRRGLVPGNYLELVPNLNAPPYRMRDSELCVNSQSPLNNEQESFLNLLYFLKRFLRTNFEIIKDNKQSKFIVSSSITLYGDV